MIEYEYHSSLINPDWIQDLMNQRKLFEGRLYNRQKARIEYFLAIPLSNDKYPQFQKIYDYETIIYNDGILYKKEEKLI